MLSEGSRFVEYRPGLSDIGVSTFLDGEKDGARVFSVKFDGEGFFSHFLTRGQARFLARNNVRQVF